jgi:signal transduction histidine kinase
MQGDRHVLIVVEDSGPGLSEEVLEHMFQPFFSTKPTGIGMGLAICRRIVETHGGRIWAENRGAGGARVSFQLPVVGNLPSTPDD